ncbi:MAG TPA: hypothetical protein DIW64_22440 [Cellvibrio sp.]|nr:hypothetical protein [Cellvibrio sp.]
MKSLLLISTLASSLLLANNALADREHRHKHKHHDHHRHSYQVVEYTEYARVVSSRPIYRTVAVEVPMDSCHVETVAYSERQRGGDSFKGTVVGGLIGAAIGHEVGRSNHATAAGGLIGAAIGNDVAGGSRRVTRYEDREVCNTRYRTEYERQLVGYDVTYAYDDRIYHTETRHHPGARIVHVRGRH